MSLILATGSNLGDKLDLLGQAKFKLCEHFQLLATSEVFSSTAVEKTDQPDFYNQVLEFELPNLSPLETLKIIQNIEKILGRVRKERYGARNIDIDIIFWDLEVIDSTALTVPHPKWQQRSFVVRPLAQLPFFQRVEKCFTIVKSFTTEAYPLKRI